MGTVAFVLTACEEPPTPHTLLRPTCSFTTVFLPALSAYAYSLQPMITHEVVVGPTSIRRPSRLPD
eukprot:6062168-Prorocentrum_lima.AAC.1